jgi:O-antigen ligase
VTFVLLAGLFVVPLVFSYGLDAYRLPKLLFSRAEAVVLLAILGTAWLQHPRVLRPAVRLDYVIVGAALGWTIVCTFTSTNRLVSVCSVVTVAVAATLYIAALEHAKYVRSRALYFLFGSALLNCAVFALQHWNIWLIVDARTARNTYTDLDRMRVAEAALLGNRNDVGTFLVLPIILCIALASHTHTRGKWLHWTVALLMTIGLLGARTVTAIAAVGTGVITLAMIRSWKKGLAATVGLIAVISLYFALYPPVRQRGLVALEHLRNGNFDPVFSGRFVAYRAAWQMFNDHPIFGVGPGRFGGEFFTYVIAMNMQGPAVNFGEVHNDHLQLLAETGVAGYAVFVSVIAIFIAAPLRATRHDDGQAIFAQSAGIGAAVSLAVLAIGQFPLQLGATIVTYSTVAGLLRGWMKNP